ncbi:MAG: hypothetical protein H6526_08750 [Actinobacteria bacterium]|nr:hypothetical protein [Actinomycetota bacterium]MCB8996542.1 hypothetical protein [Actinomycetota bacterium]MCB9415361.1 hypothetical protein [Actinomycetota bacterium]HRY08558.1 hypothetical protein [Candidatus Nanopelagicales bacterium]
MLQWYSREILEPGRQPMFFALMAFLVTFLVTRMITRMIRAGKGPFGNVSAGDVHIHHVVPGLVILLIGGVLALGSGQDGLWRQVAGVMFGVGAALVLDEFAMVLHMDDVYWSNQGRLSADAVTLTAVVLFVALLIIAPNKPNPNPVTGFWLNAASSAVFLVVWGIPITVTFLKGKLWFGALSIAVIPVAWVACIRLARPGSPWAHFRYRNKPKKQARAQARAEKWVRRQKPFRDWIATHLFGLTEDTNASK